MPPNWLISVFFLVSLCSVSEWATAGPAILGLSPPSHESAADNAGGNTDVDQTDFDARTQFPDFSESNLPLILIDTFGYPIVADPPTSAAVKVIFDPENRTSRLDSSKFDYEGAAFLTIRGYTSRYIFKKKSYNLTLVNEDDIEIAGAILGLPPDSEWVLYGPYADKSLIRNYLAYSLSRSIGRYAPRTRFVELFLNENGENGFSKNHYHGVYLLVEKIKRGRMRVTVEALSPSIHQEPEITGGYILELKPSDRVKWGENYKYFKSALGNNYYYVYPKPGKISEAQTQWIRDYMDKTEVSICGKNSGIGDTAVSDYIDVDSFADILLLNELLRNQDLFYASTFFYKDRGNKLGIGPLWDFNISIGDIRYGDYWRTDGWYKKSRGGCMFALYDDSLVVKRLRARWKELRKLQFKTATINNLIDSAADHLAGAQRRNFQRWPVLGRFVKPNRKPYSQTFEEEIQKVKNWLSQRSRWIDDHIDEL